MDGRYSLGDDGRTTHDLHVEFFVLVLCESSCFGLFVYSRGTPKVPCRVRYSNPHIPNRVDRSVPSGALEDDDATVTIYISKVYVVVEPQNLYLSIPTS